MAKVLSMVLSVIVGAALSVGAAYGVATSQTAAPKKNPVTSQIIDYGTAK